MPGLSDSRWSSKPTCSAPGPASTSNSEPEGTNRHVPIPSSGYAPPSASVSKPATNSSAVKLPSTPTFKPALPPPTAKRLNRAEIAGKAAAKRMGDLQSDSDTPNKTFIYQNYGYSAPHPSLPARPSTTPSALPPLPFNSHPTAETAEKERARLHKLFNNWVPRADEFYKTYATLDLTANELKAIQDEIVSYRVNSAVAMGKRTPYRADWETAPVCLPPQRGVDGDGVCGDTEDPLVIGLPTVPMVMGKEGTTERMDLLD